MHIRHLLGPLHILATAIANKFKQVSLNQFKYVNGGADHQLTKADVPCCEKLSF